MAGVDAAISIIGKIAECFLPQIERHLGYFVHYNRKIENLRNKVEGLEMIRNEVEESVAEATRNVKVIKPDVEKWLRSVNNTITEANAILQNEMRWFNVRSRYRSGKRAERKAKFIVELQGRRSLFDCVWKDPPPRGIESMSTGDFFRFPSTDLAFRKVMEALTDDHINIIGIYGMGGVGKTTLVTEVGKRAKSDRLFDEVLMAVVSRNSNEERIQDEIARMLGLKFKERSNKQDRADMLSRRLKQLMEEGKRILLILDDVWEELGLADIGIPSTESHKQLKIVLTTRNQDVCRQMLITPEGQINLGVLLEEESWSLFSNNAGNVVDSTTLNGVAREVCKECGGLPIALVTVGRALRDIKSPEEWEAALRELRHAKPITVVGVDEKVYACLKLSYDYLRSEEAKQIFLLCCLFPEDHDIGVETLVYYAVGKGTFQHIANKIEEVRNSVRATINRLQASSLLLASEKRECVKMHDVTRDVAISIASTSEKDMFFVRASVGLKEWPRNVASACEDFTAISLMYNEIKELPVGLKCPKLKILSLRGNGRLQFQGTKILDTFFEGMTSLEVLDLNSVSVSSVTSKSIEFPRNLRVLIWSSSTWSFDDTWSSAEFNFGKLRHLEMLDLSDNPIGELPKEIGQLENLRLLDLRDCGCHIKVAQSTISCLSQLEELYLDWDGILAEGAVDWFDQLKSLSRLNILYVRIVENGNQMGFSDIRFHLSKFQISFGNICSPCITQKLGEKTPLMDGINAFLEQTKYLGISQPLNSFRNFLCHLNENSIGLKCLENLVLEKCRGIEHLINVDEPTENSQLSLCPHLQDISLIHMNDLKTICHGSLPATGCLWKLRVLKIQVCKKLSNVVSSNLLKMFQHLANLNVMGCDALEEVFDLNDHENICAQEGDAFPPLSSLTTLTLSYLARLQTIWKGPTQFFRLHNLRNVNVSDCPQLRYLFSRDLPGTLLQLKYLEVSECDALEEVFDLNDHENICAQEGDAFPPLSSLTRLTLSFLPELQAIWKGPTQFFRLHNLSDARVSYCSQLRYLFSRDLAGTLLQLKYLKVFQCDALEEVFDLNDHENICAQEGDAFLPLSSLTTLDLYSLPRLQTIWKGPTQFFRLHNLTNVYVSYCPQLRYLFSRDLAGTLLQLEDLAVSGCKELEEVVEWKVTVDKIVFPRLYTVHLQDLPSLSSFCSGTVPSEFPSLSKLLIRGCPKLKIFASGFQSTQDRIHFTYDEYGSWEDIYVEDPNVAIQKYLDMKKVETNTSECHRTEEEEEASDHEQGNSDEGSSSVPQASAVIGGT